MSRASLLGAQLQARLQVASEDAGASSTSCSTRSATPTGALVRNRGLLALPEPVVGDLFFDIEGARYYSEDGKEFGLQYLFGIIDTADVDAARQHRGTPRSGPLTGGARSGPSRSSSTSSPSAASAMPGLHVYHYNHYETDGGRPPHRAARDPAGGRRPADGPVRDPRGRGR